MIRITRDNPGPPVLLRDGAAQTKEDEQAYDLDPDAYDRGDKTFDVARRIYAHDSVKSALRKAQHDKCAFCEAKVTHVSYGDVEHFRPKKGFRQNPGDPLGRPGYYWLAYAWGNLFLSCQLCNQRYKRNLFPLADPRQRARNHHHDISAEEPLFIDPGETDPETLIGFREEYHYPIDANPCAETTINELDLNREALAEHRRDRLKVLQTLKEIADLDIPEAANAKTHLRQAIQDSAEYAAMARACLTTAA